MDTPCARFTAAEGGARLAMTAGETNTLTVEYASFISTRMIFEHAHRIRGSLFDGYQRSVYVCRASRVEVVAFELNILTDLTIAKGVNYEDVYDWYAELDKKQVLICTSAVLKQILEEEILSIPNINIMVIDSCHLISTDECLQYIMKCYKESDENTRPRVLALTYPLFTTPKQEETTNVNEKLPKSDKPSTNLPKTDTQIDETTHIEENLPKIIEIADVLPEQKTEKEPTEESKENITEMLLVNENSEELDENEVKYTKKELVLEQIGVYENYDDFDMYEKLEWKIEQLEKDLCCKMDLAEDIDGGKRLSGTTQKPRELIIEYNEQRCIDQLSEDYVDLETFMKQTIADAEAFLDEHRYDPTEIYGEDMLEEFMNIPDPILEPKQLFQQFLYVLDQLGPYAADKAAFSLLTKLEKLKIKVPYERHFLLLCLCTTVFVKIRCYSELVFSKYESDWDKIKLFCTPKVLRLAEILEKFKPPDTSKNNDNKNDNNKNGNKTNEMLRAIEECDFVGLSNKIEDKVNIFETNLKDIEDSNVENAQNAENTIENDIEKAKEAQSCQNEVSTSEKDINHPKNDPNTPKTTQNHNQEPPQNNQSPLNPNSIPQNDITTPKTKPNGPKPTPNHDQDHPNPISTPQNDHSNPQSDLKVPGFQKRQGHRARGRSRVQRTNAARLQQMQLNPDALCGIVFMKEPLMAKIMFMLIVDMSHSHPKLSYLGAQYCAVEKPADPGTELKKCQRQGKKQEEVLKKFRMHECNLLLATSALEEGIDLPRCNLVLRWDLPSSYRSYGLCRGRARAARSACALLAAGSDTHTLLRNVAAYRELDQIINRKCGCGIQNEPPQEEEDHTDSFTHIVKPYTPNETENKDSAHQYSIDKSNDQKQNNNYKNSDNNINNTKTSETENNNKNKENNLENLICNKCGNTKNSVNIVCSCLTNTNNNSENKNNNNKKFEKKCEDAASVDLSSAIALINRYCGKLPSDTFTRLAPQWWMEKVALPTETGTKTAYICTLRLPLNCPVKYNIVGHPMPTKVLARRMVALQACRILHKSGELDNQLMPIGKENFKAAELESAGNIGDASDSNDSARPGTTKRRQYYYKRTAWAFTDCQPIVDAMDEEIENNPERPIAVKPDVQKPAGTKRNMLYALVSGLWCALPERYNTRGRRLHAPQHATQAIGILMAREQPDSLQIPAFPVYTRSGEVRVSVEYVPDADVRMSPRRGRLVRRFMRFVFAEVLRVRRRGMKLQSEGSTHNNYYIVPTVKMTREDGSTKIDIDWSFLELIYQHTEEKKMNEAEKGNLWKDGDHSDVKTEKKEGAGDVKKMKNPLLKEGETFVFDAEKYREAVVTPWYRNQDQPQFFLVAEICWNLTPESAFPSATHTTFREYYSKKYDVTLTQSDQPLLDVDHTSNRLNLLTPRYVNRKGVALPVSCERTRRAKRDRLDQKQILVPELCRVHPFAAPLWFASVALPCVLYRINALLIADEIRRSVAIDVGLGVPKIDENTCPGFQWPPLDFGWSLAEVLSADSEKNEKKKEEDESSAKQKETEIQNEDTSEKSEDEKKEKTINDILQEKEANESGFEIGTWSNEMASSIPEQEEYNEYLEPLPPNLTFCTSASGGTNWCDPIVKPKSEFQPSSKYSMADSDCSYMSSDFDTDDSDLNSVNSDEDTDNSGFCSSKNSNAAMGVRIEYKTAHEAEAVDVERKKKVRPAPQPDLADDDRDRDTHLLYVREGQPPAEYIEKFHKSVSEHKKELLINGSLIKKDEPLKEVLPEIKESHEKLTRNSLENESSKEVTTDSSSINCKIQKDNEIGQGGSILSSKKINNYNTNIDTNITLNIDNETQTSKLSSNNETQISNFSSNIETQISKISSNNETQVAKIKNTIEEIFPYGNTELFKNGEITLENIEKSKRKLLSELKKSLLEHEIKKLNCFSMVDVDIDSPNYVNEKVSNVGFDSKEAYVEKVEKWRKPDDFKPYFLDGKSQGKEFDFDFQPNLEGHPGPSPSVILQALTMSNANDGINLERLETIGDSFLKFAITAYLYCAHPTVHEGKLSHMRSKQVSNLNLYRLGRNKRLGARMIASKFEPHDNWLPPCHKPPSTLNPKQHESSEPIQNSDMPQDSNGCFIPYNLITQHSIPDKSIADCVEALIGAYLLECGPRGALIFMSWLGIRVLPQHRVPVSPDHPYLQRTVNIETPRPPPSPKKYEATTDSESSDDEEDWSPQDQDCGGQKDWSWPGRPVGSCAVQQSEDGPYQIVFGELKAPPSPLLRYIEDPEGELERMLSGYDALERTLQYRFRDRSLLLQALTHASHQQNRLTDCYQRLEFLGDAILDYLITRHLYEDPRRHSPGALTDLRSALVNNTIFATLAARHGFHKYFRHMSPGLNEVLTKYVKIQEENGHSISEEHYFIQEDEMEQAEDVEVPKALGDLFESVAGAIFLDSGMSLAAVWKSYVNLMGAELEAFSAAAPKSPVRELLETEPDTAKFGKPERLADGRRVRVCVEVFGRGSFKGVGRNYRIAKGTAARCALRHLKGHRR